MPKNKADDLDTVDSFEREALCWIDPILTDLNIIYNCWDRIYRNMVRVRVAIKGYPDFPAPKTVVNRKKNKKVSGK